jgi:hypothetical protein
VLTDIISEANYRIVYTHKHQTNMLNNSNHYLLFCFIIIFLVSFVGETGGDFSWGFGQEKESFGLKLDI